MLSFTSSRLRIALWKSIEASVRDIEASAQALQKNITEPDPAVVQSSLASIRKVFDDFESSDLLDLSCGQRILDHAIKNSSESNTTKKKIGFFPAMYTDNTGITIFSLPPGCVLPLHDHPGMHVLCRVLRGTLYEFSADWSDEKDSVVVTSCGACPSSDKTTKLIRPNGGGVLHEFWSAADNDDGAIFIDFFCPRYDGPPKFCDCSYYMLPDQTLSLQQLQQQRQALPAVGSKHRCVAVDGDAQPDMVMFS